MWTMLLMHSTAPRRQPFSVSFLLACYVWPSSWQRKRVIVSEGWVKTDHMHTHVKIIVCERVWVTGHLCVHSPPLPWSCGFAKFIICCRAFICAWPLTQPLLYAVHTCVYVCGDISILEGYVHLSRHFQRPEHLNMQQNLIFEGLVSVASKVAVFEDIRMFLALTYVHMFACEMTCSLLKAVALLVPIVHALELSTLKFHENREKEITS